MKTIIICLMGIMFCSVANAQNNCKQQFQTQIDKAWSDYRDRNDKIRKESDNNVADLMTSLKKCRDELKEINRKIEECERQNGVVDSTKNGASLNSMTLKDLMNAKGASGQQVHKTTSNAQAIVEAQVQEIEAQVQEVEAQAQEVKAQAQEVKAQTQEVKAQTQDVEAQAQEVKAQTQDVEAQTQDVEAQKQDVEAQKQAVEAQKQEVEAQKQAVEAQKQAVEAQKQAQKQEVEAQKQAVEAQKQEVEAQKQAVEAQKQEVEAQKQAVEVQKQAVEAQKQAVEAQKQAILQNRDKKQERISYSKPTLIVTESGEQYEAGEGDYFEGEIKNGKIIQGRLYDKAGKVKKLFLIRKVH
ncbi:MAG: hypothetical protein LBF59_03730 [Prevotellaceae bacterium]|jgi:chromosome segregation ATPase|nr:hypothetical protein [Prevotellaceae bacterium]